MKKTILLLILLLVAIMPFRSKLYKTPELTEREVYEIQGKWRAQLRELNPEPDKIEIRTRSNPEFVLE